ncbi:protein RGF1 INDUCIBLE TRANSCRIPTION FACTOR 1 isoform X1 [Ricinus communis]|uniref:protein RGF1 INDUCIBLE TRANSCRIPTION FACTOR 1 isoform X1 n=1 Tax=Ricinus communis TaxID=3988 RepID=UPI00201A8A4F|nr:protein RGF1 INDUCIBLE TRANSCRIPTION FACTOR 1 isoform X1 [Ricinus communis]XP_048228536.1 protein RGF1 INDUCIBLE TRANSCRIPTION FACTOR 1 isoform X1 [Ricinus communis]XP_048228537.1 protein RGF1 INDUCIBLE TRANSCRIPTION FACTOR 1 isoform X1 [Ricinus communis]
MARENRYHSNTSSRRGGNEGDDGGDELMMMNNNNNYNNNNDGDDDDNKNYNNSGSSNKPAWLEGLMAETFFGGCGVHENSRKNEKNIFCLLCCLSICPHCLPSHHSHPLLQVRRYVYHDVVRLGDLEKLIDCSYIQPYTINSAKVIFLNQRPQSRSCKGSANVCFTCDRILQEPFHFCSLSCKVDHLVDQGEDLSAVLYRFDESDFAFSQFEGLRMDGSEIIDEDSHIPPSSILEDQVQFKGSSCSNETMANSGISQEAEVVKRKKKGSGFIPGFVLSLSSRRKGAPHRAPFS